MRSNGGGDARTGIFAPERGAGDIGGIRRLNRRAIIEAILARKTTSRIELGRETHLSASTVGSIVNELVAQGVLAEVGTAESVRGRKPIVLQIRPRAATVIGIDLNDLAGCVFDLEARPCADYVRLPKEGGIQPEDVAHLVQSVLAARPADAPAPSHIGISVPGSIDGAAGRVLFSSNLDWSDVPLAQIVSSSTNLPVSVESNMVCLALSEAWGGVAQGVSDFVYLHAGWRGVGAGLMLNGEIVRGTRFNAAEVGHLQVDPRGARCRCGQVGCLETLASGRAITERARARLADWNGTGDAAQGRRRLPTTFGEVLDAANAGDPACRTAIEEAGAALANAVAIMATVVDPELVVMGGSCMAAAGILLPALRAALGDRAAFMAFDQLRILPAQDAEQKSAAGAAQIAVRRLLCDGY